LFRSRVDTALEILALRQQLETQATATGAESPRPCVPDASATAVAAMEGRSTDRETPNRGRLAPRRIAILGAGVPDLAVVGLKRHGKSEV
jgi:hypothetical protein